MFHLKSNDGIRVREYVDWRVTENRPKGKGAKNYRKLHGKKRGGGGRVEVRCGFKPLKVCS